MIDRRDNHQSILDAGTLPVEEVAVLARREAVRPRDAYQAHKWFARRLAATARSLLVAGVTRDGDDFWEAYYGKASCEGMTVLDPFMGGSVMLLEASRLGADVVGYDIEPVAVAVSEFQGRLPSIPDLTNALEFLKSSVAESMAPYYATMDADGNAERILHAHWAQVVDCGSCGFRFDAMPSSLLASDKASAKEWIVCRGCSEITERRVSSRRNRCSCGCLTGSRDATVVRGTAACPSCGHSEKLIEVARRTGRPQFRLLAVETIPAGIERRFTMKERSLRKASEADIAVYESACEALAMERARDPGFICESPIPKDGRTDGRLTSYGYHQYEEMFNARQLLHLGRLAREIEGITGIVGEALRIAFSDHLTTNNLFCAYAQGWRRLSPLFSIKAYRHICRPVEINPWLEQNGRGTFPNAVRSVMRAADSLRKSQEPTADGKMRQVPQALPGKWKLRCGDSSSLDAIADGTVDLVLTDPPYFDYIPYSELGHFYVPWMTRLGLIGPGHLTTLPREQLAAKKRGVAAQEIFAEKLEAIFRECSKKAKADARIAFTYQNYDGHGWQALGKALARAGIRIENAWPMYGDSGASIQKSAKSISWDCVVVGTFGHEPCSIDVSDTDAEAGKAFADGWWHRLEKAGFGLTDGDHVNMQHVGSLTAAFRRRKRDDSGVKDRAQSRA